jgi:hypothetical protein
LSVSSTTNDGVIRIQEDYVRIIGLQIIQTDTSTSGVSAIGFQSINNPSSILIDRCILRTQTGSSGNGCIHIATNNVTLTVRNTIIFGSRYGVYIAVNATLSLDNCVLINNQSGGLGKADLGSTTFRNCYLGGNGYGDIRVFFGSVTCTTTATSDNSTDNVSLRGISYDITGACFVDTTANAEDLRLQDVSKLVNAGTDLSGDFTTDITGTTRSGTWDIGAHEYSNNATIETYKIYGGYNPAWATYVLNMYVQVGDTCTNDSNKVYQCIVSGQCASSGGPTGTGSYITDNTAVWRYVGPAVDYSNITSFEAAKQADLVSANKIIIAQFYPGVMSDNDILFDGWTTGHKNYIKIEPYDNTAKFMGTYDLSKCFIYSNAGLEVREEYFRVYGLQLDKDISTSANLGTFGISNTLSNVIFDSCLIRGGGVSSGAVYLYAGNVLVRNCVVTNAVGAGIYTTNTPKVFIENCTIVDGGTYGINADGGTVLVVNTYCGNNTTDAYNGTMTRTTCAHSSATSFSGSTANIAFNTDNFASTSGSNGPIYPTSVAQYDIGNVDWVNPSNGLTSDNNYASVTIDNIPSNGFSDILHYSNFSFTIPSNAVIRGVKFEVEGYVSSNFLRQFSFFWMPNGTWDIRANVPQFISTSETWNTTSNPYYWPHSNFLAKRARDSSYFGIGAYIYTYEMSGTGRIMYIDNFRAIIYWDSNVALNPLASSILRRGGTNLSGKFSVDVKGSNRPSGGTWSIGAFDGSFGPYPHYTRRNLLSGGMLKHVN